MSGLSDRPDDAVVGLALPHESAALHVTGHALNRSRPHESGIWTFEDLGSRRQAKAALTPAPHPMIRRVVFVIICDSPCRSAPVFWISTSRAAIRSRGTG